jgi:asparagine synthase (glutamine-hydrolysing)
MCGICGYITKNNIDKSILKMMNDTITYRGPNDEGYSTECSKSGLNISLAHKRLSILDLSSLGHQPMESIDKQVILIFNGEIYNFKDIKNELINKGYEFKSTSDTEVIIYSYKQWGLDCFKKFNGMFAIALYDREFDELYLVRDRVGVKPLYYYFVEEQLVFASELKPILKYPYFKKEIDNNSIAAYLSFGFIAAPHTIFKNTYKLQPGHILKFKNNKIIDICYWDINKAFKTDKFDFKNENQFIKELDYLMNSSVKYRMISDVPVGAFLSGGIDSSLVTAIMQNNSMNKVKTFTIGFEEKGYNEAIHAKKVAKYLGTEHYEEYLSLNKIEELIFQMPKFYDEPFSDPSQLATFLVSQIAKKQVTVALSGDGGDELFCGYDKYYTALRLKKFKLISYLSKAIISKNPNSILFNRKLAKLSYLTDDINVINSNYLTSNLFILKILKNSYKVKDKYFNNINCDEFNIQEKYMYQDMITYLPDDILTKVDRASMAVSLEGRNPILDYRIVEFAFRCPHKLKSNKDSKYLLRKLLYKYVPRDLVDRPKQGFAVPVYKWLHEGYRKYIDIYFNKEYILKQGIFNYEEVQNLIRLFDKNKDVYIDSLVWKMFMFQIWYNEYIE